MSDVLPDPLRELLRCNALGIANDVRVVLQSDVAISVAHKPGDNVNRGAGFEQFRSDAMPKAVNPDVNALRSFNPKFSHCPMNAVFHNVVGQVGFALRVGEGIGRGIDAGRSTCPLNPSSRWGADLPRLSQANPLGSISILPRKMVDHLHILSFLPPSPAFDKVIFVEKFDDQLMLVANIQTG